MVAEPKPDEQELQPLPDQEGAEIANTIRILGGPRHDKKMIDPGTPDWKWNGHLYWRTKLTFIEGGMTFQKWCYVYFGFDDYVRIDGNSINYSRSDE